MPGYFSGHDRLGILDYDVIRNNLQSRVEHKPMRSQISFLLPLLEGTKKQEVEKQDGGWVTEEETEVTEKEKEIEKETETDIIQKKIDIIQKELEGKKETLKLPKITSTPKVCTVAQLLEYNYVSFRMNSLNGPA